MASLDLASGLLAGVLALARSRRDEALGLPGLGSQARGLLMAYRTWGREAGNEVLGQVYHQAALEVAAEQAGALVEGLDALKTEEEKMAALEKMALLNEVGGTVRSLITNADVIEWS